MIANPHSRRQIYILTLVFLIPMVFATLVFLRGKPFGHPTNRGYLISPPITITEPKLPTKTPQGGKRIWTLMLIAPEKCDKQCQGWLHQMHQIHKATGKYQPRVQRVLLSYQPVPQTLQRKIKNNYAGTTILVSKKRDLLEQIKHAAPQILDFKRISVYLVDPKANIMMGYKPDTNPSDVLKDLKHLLRVA